ncbi:MAG: hypothetical protein NUV98_00140, partial [Candidatus Roizmanbacteria bacterium]|nr:hypothetical protein [Candidatus Roizmanbacteria bacterium]
MIDLNLLRKNPQLFRDGTKNKNINPDTVDAVLRFDEERRDLIGKVEELRGKRNQITNEIQSGTDRAARDQKIAEVRVIKKKLNDIEPRLKQVELNLEDLSSRIPNPPLPDVKAGKDDTENEIL